MVKDLTEQDKKNISAAFHKANYFWIVVSMFLGLLSHVSRAVRWKMLLKPLGYNPRLSNTFFAVMIGYLANYALPRLGEVSRCGILNKYEKIPFTESFGTVIAERAIDLICLTLIFCLTLFIQLNKIINLANEKIFYPLNEKIHSLSNNHSFIIIYMAVIMATILTLLLFFRKKIKSSVFDKFKGLLLGFWNGLKTIKSIKSPGRFVFHSVLIWCLYYFSLHVCFFSFEETRGLTIGQGLAVFIFGSIGVVFVPGGTGAYQKLVIDTLTSPLATITFSVAFAFAWIVWTSQLILLVGIGVISLLLLPLVNKK